MFHLKSIRVFSLVVAACLGIVGAQAQDVFQLVTSTSQLKAGDLVVIANATAGQAMSTNQKTNNRGAVAVTISGNQLTTTADVQVLTLGGQAGAWTFFTGDGYLYAGSSSSNVLKTEEIADDNAKAKISIGSDHVVAIDFQGSNSHNSLRYNSNNNKPLFSCYASTSSIDKTLHLFRKDGTPVKKDTAVTGISAFNGLDDGTVARLYLSDDENVRVVKVSGDTAVVKDADAELRFVRVVTNPAMKVGQHVAGYITAKKESDKGLSLLTATAKTNSAWLVIADRVTEPDVTFIQDITVRRTASEAIYNLQGQYVGTDADRLSKGVYLRDGKKFIKM